MLRLLRYPEKKHCIWNLGKIPQPSTHSFQTYQAFRPFLEPLFVFDAWHFKLVPWLAESSEWINDLTLRIKLHDGTKWNDGQSLTSADINYTFCLPIRKSEITGVIADLWTYLDSITVVNSTTIDFVLKAENPNKYILTQALTQIEILPMHIWTEVKTQYASLLDFTYLDNPVGSGPYKLMYSSGSYTEPFGSGTTIIGVNNTLACHNQNT